MRDFLTGGQLFETKTSFALPFLMVFKVDLVPKATLPLFMTRASLVLIFSWVAFLTICEFLYPALFAIFSDKILNNLYI